MSTGLITALLSYFLVAWLASLAAVIGLRLLRGDLSTLGMLRADAKSPIDPERVTMLLVTVLVLGGYAMTALSTGATFNDQTNLHQLPDAPDILLLLLAGGNTTYLAGKITRQITGKD